MNDLSMLCGDSEINFQQIRVHIRMRLLCVCVCARMHIYLCRLFLLAVHQEFNLLRKQQFISMVGLYVRRPIREEIKSIHVFNHVTF